MFIKTHIIAKKYISQMKKIAKEKIMFMYCI